MADVFAGAIERLRERIATGAPRLAIQAPPGHGKTAVLAGLARSLAGIRRVVRVELPEADDAALVALVEAATQLDFVVPGLLDFVVPRNDPARVAWATRLAAVRDALGRAGDDVVVLLDEPRFEPGALPGGELFAARAVEITEMLLGTRGTVVLAGARMPHGIAQDAGVQLPLLRNAGDVAPHLLASVMDGAPRSRPLPPVVIQVLAALRSAGVDIERIPPKDLQLQRLVAHDLGRVFLERSDLRGVIARLTALRVPFPSSLLEGAGASALAEQDRSVIEHLLATLEDGTRIVPAALSQAIRRRIAHGDPAWAPDEPSGDAHHFAAQHHRARFEAARVRGDVAAAIRDEMEEIHQLTMAGDAPALLTRSLQFVEQYDALGKALSQRALRAPRDEEERFRREAVRAYERAIEHDERDAYAHHYIAYNLDILALERERVNREYVIAKELDPRHPWYHSRHVCFLITIGRVADARAAWERALENLEEAEGPRIGPSGYRELHAEVANHLLSRAHLVFAREVIDEVPDERRDEPWWRALNQLRVCLEEDRDERLVFPPTLSLEARWAGPHLITGGGERAEVTRWHPGRVLGRDDEIITLSTVERAACGEEKPVTVSLKASAVETQWGLPERMLVPGTFVELLEYDDGTREMRTWDAPSSSFSAIANLPGLFPRPDRYIRRGFAGSH